MSEFQITKEQACAFLTEYHGLNSPYIYEGKEGIMEYFQKAGCIQFDTLNVVGRNPDLVLQARVKKYKATLLQELLYKDRRLVDQWDKEMSIYPVEDWPFFERNRQAALHRYGAIEAIQAELPYVREAIRCQGPVTSSDLEHDQIIDWSWAPSRLSRAILESMYHWGELIVYDKAGARKRYDFADQHIPRELLEEKDPNASLLQYHKWHILRRIGAVGLLWNKAGDAWLGIKELKSQERNEAFRELLEEGCIVPVKVEGVKLPLFIKKEEVPLLDRVLAEGAGKPRAAVLAPLDNLLWDRRLIQELFGFEYRWEVYKPAAERRYGYYVLPVLYGSRFVGRFEPVLDKSAGQLVIKNWWWEAHVKPDRKLRQELQKCIKGFASFTEAKALVLGEGLESFHWLLP
jgi:uncharacterized protein YcaQ